MPLGQQKEYTFRARDDVGIRPEIESFVGDKERLAGQMDSQIVSPKEKDSIDVYLNFSKGRALFV